MKKENRPITAVKTAVPHVKHVARQITEDKISVYAAQASFFVIISAIPFLSLLLSILSFFIPADIVEKIRAFTLSESIAEVLGGLLADLRTMPNVSLLSISVITVLWSASKGVAAIRTGIETVYHAQPSENFVFHRLRALSGTLVFMVLILAIVVLLMFGNFIGGLLSLTKITDLIMLFRTPFILLFMCVVFTWMYYATAKRSSIRRSIWAHLPGAVFTSVGWILFSYCYSLYITYFPSASYIYGGLAAVCLMMLWAYFCMIILLLGAELNKLLWERAEAK